MKKKNNFLSDFQIPADKEFDVVGMGLNAFDYLCVIPGFPRPGDKMPMKSFSVSPGGQTATALCCLARLGFKTRYIGKFGGDDTGKLSRESLLREGIDLEYCHTLPGISNQRAFIMVDEKSGERTIIWDRPREIGWSPDELPPEALASGRILLLDGHDTAACIAAAKYVKDDGIPVVLDAETVDDETAELIKFCDVVIGTADFTREFTGESDLEKGLVKLASYVPGFTGVTMGAAGAAGYYDGRIFRSGGFSIRAADTTGAGDVFHGSFIAGMLSGWGPDFVLQFADGAAALSCRGIGGRATLPDMDEVLKFLKDNEISPPKAD